MATASLLSMATAANATMEIMHRYPCDNGNTVTYLVIHDKATGKRWLIREWSDKTSRVDPLETVSAAPSGPITVPANFSDQCAASQAITTPGADLGVTILDANNQEFRFRNCLNEQERAEGNEAVAREFFNDPALATLKPDIGIGGYAEAKALNDFISNRPTENSPGGQLGQEYFDRNYGANGNDGIAVVEALSKDKIFFYIIKNNTDVAIESAPTAGNNYQLIVRNVDPKVAVATEVIRSSGEVVWRNTVAAATPVDLSQCSSGTYFVKGGGQPIAVTIAR
ncbi:MAG: hypothetical protein K1X90_05845 [Candidatus Kapabacteria bacterium]|nr:hypothetical protein [Candidatus Kapabacteria bacterium]